MPNLKLEQEGRHLLVVEGFRWSPREHCTQGIAAVLGEAHVLELFILVKDGKHSGFSVFWDSRLYQTLQQYPFSG